MALTHVLGADVHEGEAKLVIPFFLNLFLLLTAYYILKVVREPLILLGGSAVERSYAQGLQAVLLVVLIPAYSFLANHVEPARLVKWITAVFVVSLFLFFAARRAGLPVGFAFFVWLGIFSTLSIAQFWSIANDVMTEAEGRRLFPLVAVGGTAGGVLGAQFAARALARVSPESLMLVAAALLVLCMLLTHAGHLAALDRKYGAAGPPVEPRDPRGGFTLVLADRYLLLIGLSVIVLNLITATGDFVLAQMVSARAHALPVAQRGHFVGAFYGDLQTWVTVLTTVVQIFVVARVFKVVGIGGALFFMPLIVIVGYAGFALAPLLAAVTAVKVGESTTDYSLQNTIEHGLFLSTSRDAKYKAKSAIDTISKRLGDLGSTALVFLGTRAALGVRGFAIVNVVAGLLWIWIALHLKRRQRAMMLAVVVCLVISTSPARADPPAAGSHASPPPAVSSNPPKQAGKPRRAHVAWASEWPRFRWWEYAGTGVAWGLDWYVRYHLPPPDHAVWVGNNPFDDTVRGWLRLSSPGGRATAVTVSDRLSLAGTAFPFVVDLPVALLAHRQPGVMWQLLMMDLESFAVAGLINNSLYHVAGRGRPNTQSCAADPSYDPLCGGIGDNASLPSGHVLTIATATGLTCVHHRYLPLYGADIADESVCVLMSLATVATGFARIMADRHFATDVLMGGAIGFGSGYGLPWLLHYRVRRTPEAGPEVHGAMAILPLAGPGMLGLSVVGVGAP